MDIREKYNELNSLLCNQDKALKELVWTIHQNKKLAIPRNVLLIGELGSGKTTMVENVAEKMDIPLAEVSGFCSMNGISPVFLYNALCKLFVKNNSEEFKGIILIHDMRECFLYGGLDVLNALFTSKLFSYENHLIDISKVMFIGEVDINGFEDCFIEKPIYTLENLDEISFDEKYCGDEVRKIIHDMIFVDNEDEEVEEYYSYAYRQALKNTFLSLECKRAFNKKIFMESMKFENIKKVLESPISELRVYNEDLDENYMSSSQFINSIVNHIQESTVGLHDLDDAVHDVTKHDYKRKVKVYKDNSLLKF